MTCHACESLIRMDLEDAGFSNITSLSHENGVLILDADEQDADKIRQAIESSGKYKVLSSNILI